MQGPQNKINEGLIGQSIQELFDVIQVKSSKASFQVIMSYFQIYNEKIKDLLWRDSGQQIEVLEDPVRGTLIVGLAQVSVGNFDEVMELIDIGTNNRAAGQTDPNEASSRSHSVLQLFVSK